MGVMPLGGGENLTELIEKKGFSGKGVRYCLVKRVEKAGCMRLWGGKKKQNGR